MAVTSYDAKFGFRQDALARNGRDRGPVRKMTKEEYERFAKSPAMQKQAIMEEVVTARTSQRDRKRMETDPSFHPKESDWEHEKAFSYDRRVDYYRVLGVDEYEPLEGIKKAYRRLSLVYHPDKTQGLDTGMQEDYARIFIELHGAYLTLGDNPTRRQYDKQRDDLAVLDELYGSKGKPVKQFDAFQELEKRAKNKSKPAATVEVCVPVRLEKMFYGGVKNIWQERVREGFDGFHSEAKLYQLVVPRFCPEGLRVVQKHAGDHHQDQKPDHLRFKVSSKRHPRLRQSGNDLRLQMPIRLHGGALAEPFLSAEVHGLEGRCLLLFGRNPFYGADGPARGRLCIAVAGEAFREDGKFYVEVDVPGENPPEGTAQTREDGAQRTTVRAVHHDTAGVCYVTVAKDARFGHVLTELAGLLDLDAAQAEEMSLHRPLVHSGGLGPKLHAEEKVANTTEVLYHGPSWVGPRLTAERFRTFLNNFQLAVEDSEERWRKLHAQDVPLIQVKDVGDLSEAEPPLEVRTVLAANGFAPEACGLRAALEAVRVRDGDVAEDFRDRIEGLARGEAGGDYSPPPSVRRPEHPTLRARRTRAQARCAECHAELAQCGGRLELATSPSSHLLFYSNLGQMAEVPPGVVRPRALFAAVLCCPLGARGLWREQWVQLRSAMLPLLVPTVWILLRPARTLLPKALDLDVDETSSGEENHSRFCTGVEQEQISEQNRPTSFKPFVLRFGLGPPGGFAEPPRGSGAPGLSGDSAVLMDRFPALELPLWRPRRRSRAPAPAANTDHPSEPSSSSSSSRPSARQPMPWLRLGEEALSRGDAWQAYGYFGNCARVAGSGGDGSDGRGQEKDEEVAWCFARQADCLQYCGRHEEALPAAQEAARLRPHWGAAWRRVGVLAARTGATSLACEALFKAVELEPCSQTSVDALQRYRWASSDVFYVAGEEKLTGNRAMPLKPATAVAHYTVALAALQAPVGGGPKDCDEKLARLLAELHSNRAAAFLRLAHWGPAMADAERALALPGREHWVKGQLRLATALLAAGRLEEAYPYFRRVELVLPEGVPVDHPAKQGREACLALAPLWRSSAASARLTRFWRDGRRSRKTTRIFAVSDVHFDHPLADEWVYKINDAKFQEDVLIVAGDVAESLVKLRACLRYLRYKFRRVFFTPGNHDLWIHTIEEKEVPDSITKLFRVLQVCDEVDVDVCPAAVCDGVFVVPLLSWYNADFDEVDPFPSSHMVFDKFAKWPMDKDNYVWRYMLYLNRRFLEMPYPGDVVTFSHFLPRPELPYWSHIQGLAKAVGCPQLDQQLRQVQSTCHVFGHSHHHCDQVIDGVRYVQCPLGYEKEHSPTEPLRCIFDGTSGGFVSRPADIE